MKLKPDPQVNLWLKEHDRNEVFISVVTVGEIVYGFHRMPEGERKTRLNDWFEIDFMEWIQSRIFPIGESIMREWARITATSRPLPRMDSLLAATAIAADATIVTRNTKDFTGVEGLKLVNPWK
ncbi:MAG: PIN domain-containing protein [Coriobacteriia bacterium]|nr:PIN domain-containing protein [Coriobacteriia bacterium]